VLAVAPENIFQFLSLLHVRLTHVDAAMRIKEGQLPTDARIQVSVAIGVSNNQKSIHVNGILGLELKPKDAGQDSSVVTMNFEYQIVYAITNFDVIKPTPEFIQPLSDTLGKNGVMLMWPYFRELAASLMGRMSLPPIVLPFFMAGPNAAQIGGAPISFVERALEP